MRFDTMPESKCGFYISETRKKLWKVELEIFEEFDKICRENDIRYFLLGGSAIGVERHQGFIPWDDDLDIALLRSDFEKFLKCAEKQLPENLHVQYGVDDIDDASCFCRIRRGDTTAIITDQLHQKCNHGIFIELYPLDNVPQSKLLQYIQIEFSSLFRQLLECRYKNCNKGKLLSFFDVIFKGVSTKRLFKIWNWVCNLYNRKQTKMVNSVAMPVYAKNKFCYFEYVDVAETVYKPFENTQVQVSIQNDKILRGYFGDYMQFPPEDERGAHHQTIVYFDPDIPYEKALESGRPYRFFAGEIDLCEL